MPEATLGRAAEYAAAILAVAVAALLRAWLEPWLTGALPLATFYGAVAFSVWLGGLGPAVVATVLGYVAANLLFVDTMGPFSLYNPTSFAGLLAYLFSCGLITALGVGMRAAERRGADRQARLERELARRTGAEAQATELRRRLEGVLDSTTDSVYTLNREWRFTYLNPHAERYFGRPREELLGGVIWELFPSLVGSANDREYRRAVAGNTPVHFELLSPLTKRWVEVRGFPSDEGLTVFFRDITAAREASEALRESWTKLKAVLDSVTAIVYVKDLDGRYIMVNRHFCDTLRMPEAHLLGKRDDDLFAEGLAADYRAHDQAVAEGGAPKPFTEQFDHPDGRHDYLSLKFPLRSEAGAIYATGAVCTDITEMKRLEQRLIETDRLKDRFLAVLAHELRQPLQALRYAAEAIRLHTASDHARQPVQVLERQTSHLSALVDDLLDAARIKRGETRIERDVIDLRTAVGNAVDASSPIATSNGQHLVVDLPSAAVHVEGDRTRLQQVFSNLLSNAMRYTPAGGTIRVRMERVNHAVVTRVSDNGPGIAPEVLPNLFELFVHTEGAGLGIGLALVKAIVEMHGGTVAAHSEPGAGAEFEVRLPYVTVPPSPSSAGE
jgi:PAS domain S-box-containing protein